MKPPLPCLPAADSEKRHGRRFWDSLGYLRVRTLANERWQRAPPWVQQRLITERGRLAAGPDRDLLDEAIAAVKR